MKQANGEIKVKIHCLVYNHEPYLRDCLEGFVMQKTDFAFKAVVHDDCSTDNSAAIIREYAEKYPDIIEPIYETENQYRKGTLDKIMYNRILGQCRYVAYCEGDDYWTDPNKLQKQVDFLDSHPEYAMCFSACNIKKEQDNLNTDHRGEFVEDRDYTATELLQTWSVPTASILVRENAVNDERVTVYDKRKTCGDIFIVLTAAHHGKVRGMSDKMCVYRVNPGSMQQRAVKDMVHLMNRLLGHYGFIEENYPLVDRKLTKTLRCNTQLQIALDSKHTITNRLKALLKALMIYPVKTLKAIIKSH